ncbi:MAG: 6,7-dimethyl-8-ribityllumazine synthase [Candidatus Magasanikbacteria bacterium]|nr:6,7-dimethyl-8-ribityllumazine synthase [Candidatus Magasanikbacteria bacterium]
MAFLIEEHASRRILFKQTRHLQLAICALLFNHIMKHGFFQNLDGQGLKFAMAVANFNKDITERLEKWCVRGLTDAGVAEKDIAIEHVPGSFELPLTCQQFAKSGKYDAVIAIGCLIKGETMHFEYLADATFNGLVRAALDSDVPVICGVLTCLNKEQAEARSKDSEESSAYGWAKAAIEMAYSMRKD